LRKIIVSWIVFTLLLVGTLTFTFNVQPGKAWTGTVYIRADGSIDPPDAPIITYDNVTYTLTDNITSDGDGIIVEKGYVVIEGASYTVQGVGDGTGMHISAYLGASNVTVRNVTVQGFGTGIFVGSASCKLTNDFITDNQYGVFVASIKAVFIEQNEISNNSKSGVRVAGQSNLLVRDNIIRENNVGISTNDASVHSGMVILHNMFLSNRRGGIWVFSSDDSYSNAYGYIYNITVSNNTFSFNGGGALSLYSDGSSWWVYDGYGYIFDVTISNNLFSFNEYAALLSSFGKGGYDDQGIYPSSGNGYAYIYNITFRKNTVLSNVKYGITLSSYGYSPYVGGNSGVSYSYIYNVSILNNTVSSNGGHGIELYSSGRHHTSPLIWDFGEGHIYNTVISFNNVSFNNGNGIYLHRYGTEGYIGNVTLSFNNILSNNGNGTYMYSYATKLFVTKSKIYNINILNDVYFSNKGHGVCLFAYGELGGQGVGKIFNLTILGSKFLFNSRDGISIHSGENGYVYHVNIKDSKVSSNNRNGIYIVGSEHYIQLYDLAISDNVIAANFQKGILINGSINVNLTHNSVSYNSYGALYNGTSFNLATYNDIYRNSYGMNVTSGATVNATYNYWGDASGPYHESLNVNGTGNSVNGNGTDLDFIPFLTDSVGQINERPIAVLEADETTVEINQTVTFNASASTDDDRIDYYFFDFGDGTNSSWTTLPIVTHKYASEGVYNATLIVMDNLGVTSLDGDLIYVTIIVLAPPIANFSYTPGHPLIDETIIFNASASYDPDGIIETHTWNFGDGNITTVADPIIIHIYTAPDTYTVNLTVTDNDGLTHSITKSITVIADSTPPTTLHDYDGLWHTRDFTINLIATDDLSGVAEICYRINDGLTKTVSIDGQPLITTEGANNTLEYWSIDKAGNEEIPHEILTGIKLDKTAPTGSITINNEDAYTTSTSVTLTLTATDLTSGVYQVRYSNDGIWDTEPWEDFSPTKAWTLTLGNGTKTVYYQIKDNAGLVSDTYSDTIILDTTPPTGSISINDGATYTTTTTVTLTLSATDETSGIAEMRFSNDNITFTEWQTYASSKSWTLQQEDGTKIVYVQFRDHAGLISTYSDVITLDTAPPTGSITIAGDAAYTNSTSITLTLSADDSTSGIAYMRFSNDNIDWTSWEPYSTSKTWTLTTGDGTKTVYVQYMDNAGLASPTYQGTITLDTTKPTANAGADQTVNEDTLVTFDGSASTDENGIATYTWTFTDVTTKTLTGEKPTYTFETPDTYTVTLNVTDAAGNYATDTTVITVLDITKPVANAGEDQTANVGENVNFDADASSDNVGIVSYEWDFGDGATGTGVTTSHVYSTPDTYTVILTVKDAAGNTAMDSITIIVQEAEATPPPTEGFPTWMIGAAVATAAIIAAATAIFWKKRK